MQISVNQYRDFLVTHILFAIICGVVLFFMNNVAIGQKLLGLTLLYNITIPVMAQRRGHRLWLQIWQFALPFSIFNIFPDWFLSQELGVLVYPNEGVFKIGTISGYMPFLWFIPVFLILYVGCVVERWFNPALAWVSVLLLTLFTFSLSEHCFQLLGSWHAQNIHYTIGNAAVYVLIAELILMITAFAWFKAIKDHGWARKIVAAFMLMIVYMGSLVFFYFLLEVVWMMPGNG